MRFDVDRRPPERNAKPMWPFSMEVDPENEPPIGGPGGPGWGSGGHG